MESVFSFGFWVLGALGALEPLRPLGVYGPSGVLFLMRLTMEGEEKFKKEALGNGFSRVLVYFR
ncbi:MAG: hypothetical protein K2I08_09860, partial [Muribaculaceae bacterium]|nr:hypothetical protein [Muribaculaceae bacterium]